MSSNGSVLALGHFCELHGPRLVFYTIRNINEPQFVSQCPDLKFCSGCKAPLLEGYISTVQTLPKPTPTPTPSDSPLEVAISSLEKTHISSSSSGTSIRNVAVQHQSSSSSSGRRRTSSQVVLDDGSSGRGNASSTTTTATTTTRTGATKYYCSHSNYDHSHLSHLHTCIARTLSCELSPSNSVAFTSNDIWVIGTAFSLKDSQARGFHRRYCLIFTFLPETPLRPCTHDGGSNNSTNSRVETREKQGITPSTSAATSFNTGRNRATSSNTATANLTSRSGREEVYSDGDFKGPGNHYPSLVPYFEYIQEEFAKFAKSLQTECEKVYFREQSVSPQRAIRLSNLLDSSGGGSSTVPGASRGGAKVFTRNHSSGAGARSLPILTSNPHVFLD